MINTFLTTLTPMLTLFFCIAIGFVAQKKKILPENAGKVMAKMETWIFCPALNFITMATNCTTARIGEHATNIVFALFVVALALTISIFLARFFVKEKNAERGVYMYALAFANSGYVGDPLVKEILGGDLALSYYKLFCLPISITIYTWGISVLSPSGNDKKSVWKKLLNAPTVALLLGIAFGLSGLGAHLPEAAVSTLNSLKACMGPVAMLLAGVTVAKYSLPNMLKNKKVYVASALRLVAIPSVIVAAVFGLKTAASALFGMPIGNEVLFLTFFAVAAPLGLNTVVFPEAFGGNPETGASMTMISHTLCVITIPLLYAAMVALFGPCSIG